MGPAAFFYALILLFTVVFIILLLPVTIRIKIDNWRKNNFISFEIELFFLTIHRTYSPQRLSRIFQSPAIRTGSWARIFQDKYLKRKINILLANLSFFNRQLKTFQWQYMDINLKISAGDPARTALLIGSSLSISGLLSLHLEKIYAFKKRPRFRIFPSFAVMSIYFELFFQFKTSLGRLFYLGLYLLAFLFVGRWFINAGTSNSGLNENSHGKLKRNGGC